ncbi:hypothetical protein [Methylocapsa sp. S129]|uniref:hypothetical protein n=1 Tax=Methylocapsa sp. S129 TaxID=1641869 RepID=UPI00131C0FEA|nr:hypothetical protein [Methylocapsa sp. S129]
MKFLSVLAAGSQRRMRSFFIRAALALAGALSGAVGLGFATYALFYAWRLQYGVVNASIGLSAIYLILAGVLYLCSRSVGRAPIPQPTSALSGDPEAALKAQAGGAPQVAALAAGVELAKHLTPLQFAMLAALSGFVAGRRL